MVSRRATLRRLPYLGLCPLSTRGVLSQGDREPEDAGAKFRRRDGHDRRLRGLWGENGQDGTREEVMDHLRVNQRELKTKIITHSSLHHQIDVDASMDLPTVRPTYEVED